MSAIFERHSTEAIRWIYNALNYIPENDFLDWSDDADFDYSSVGDYFTFDQTEFAPGADFDSGDLEDKQEGRVYIPQQCYSDKTCRVHVVFHKAGKGPEYLAEQRGYNILGALNDIIMLYPATQAWNM